MSTSHQGPLAGVTVVELGHYIAAPSASQILADQGAHVIKVEGPDGEAARRGGEYGRAMLDAYGRGKSLVSLDLSLESEREKFRSLLQSSDILISNMRPSVLSRWSLDPTSLRAANPGLVVVTIRGYAEGSVYGAMPGYDIAAQAESAMMALTGEPGGEPQRVGAPVVDAAAGYIVAQTAVAALVGRGRDGTGAQIDVNLWDVAIHLQGVVWAQYQQTGRELRRKGNGQPGIAPAAELYRASDGFVVVSAYMAPHWRAFCEALGLHDLLGDPDFSTAEARAERRGELKEAVEDAMASITRDEVVARLGNAGVVVGGVREMSEVVRIRGHEAGSPFVASAHGDEWYLGTPYNWDAVVPHPLSRRPVGADNATFDQDNWQVDSQQEEMK